MRARICIVLLRLGTLLSAGGLNAWGPPIRIVDVDPPLLWTVPADRQFRFTVEYILPEAYIKSEECSIVLGGEPRDGPAMILPRSWDLQHKAAVTAPQGRLELARSAGDLLGPNRSSGSLKVRAFIVCFDAGRPDYPSRSPALEIQVVRRAPP